MKPWQLTYEVEQATMPLDGDTGTRRQTLAPCNALAPDSVRICQRMFPSGEWCQRLLGHPGGHSKKPSTCNRPAGHEGPHAFLVTRDARKLGEW